MSSPSRGRRALLVVAILLVVPVLGAPGIWFWIQYKADRNWADARVRIRELSTLYPVELPPAPSTEVSKELQIHFVAAIREAARRNGRQNEARQLVWRRETDAAVDLVLGDAQDFLDRLHEGARRCAAMPSDFPPGWRGEWDNFTLCFVISCGVLRARRSRERGAAGEAVEALLDALQLARFWAASGKGDNRLDALIALDHALDELRDILAHEMLSREQLRALDRELEPLEAVLRSPLSYSAVALARWGEELEQRDLRNTQLLDEAPYRWRYLLPTNLMKAEAFEFSDRHLQRLIADGEKTFLDLRRDLKEMLDQREDSKNPLIRSSTIIREIEWIGLERIAQYRLLRIAAHYRAGGEILPLKDPYGAELRHSSAGTRMKFWSLSSNGKDDGGDPGGDGRWTMPVGYPRTPAKDIVIEVPVP